MCGACLRGGMARRSGGTAPARPVANGDNHAVGQRASARALGRELFDRVGHLLNPASPLSLRMGVVVCPGLLL
jgi:hypothetical protein